MARPRSISDEQILAAARRVLFRNGTTASTAEIAREAGVSEGTVFKRFPTKDALVHRALEPPAVDWARLMDDVTPGGGDVRDNLVKVAIGLFDFFRAQIPRVMHLMLHASFDPVAFWEEKPDCAPSALIAQVSEYLQAEVDGGRLRRVDPEVLGRTLIGAMHHYAFFEVIGFQVGHHGDTSTYAEELINTLWLGVKPDDD